MTAKSFAETRRSALSILSETRPDLRVKKAAQKRIGSIRLVQVTFETGEYIQFQMLPLKTGARILAEHIAAQIIENAPKSKS